MWTLREKLNKTDDYLWIIEIFIQRIYKVLTTIINIHILLIEIIILNKKNKTLIVTLGVFCLNLY